METAGNRTEELNPHNTAPQVRHLTIIELHTNTITSEPNSDLPTLQTLEDIMISPYDLYLDGTSDATLKKKAPFMTFKKKAPDIKLASSHMLQNVENNEELQLATREGMREALSGNHLGLFVWGMCSPLRL